MDKKELIHLATNIYEEALMANSYWDIVNQYHSNISNYNDEMNYSPAFYHVVYQALVEGVFINLAKIYDVHGNALAIGTLLEEMKKISVDDFHEHVVEHYKLCGNHFQHRLKQDEECFFKKEVSEQRGICNALKIDYIHTTVELSFEEIIDLYIKKLCSIKPSIANLRVQRNKIYAHNDRQTNFDFKSIHEKNPINKNDADVLIDLALDISCLCVEILTGVSKARSYTNIDDWEASLKMITIGGKYREAYLEELLTD